MSLLLEALKRAEDDSKKRKLAAADALVLSHTTTPSAESSELLPFSQSSAANLTLQDIKPSENIERTLQAAPTQTQTPAQLLLTAGQPLIVNKYPDLTLQLSDDDINAPTPVTVAATAVAENLALHPHAKYAKPDSAVVLGMASKPEIALSFDAPEPAPPVNATPSTAPILKVQPRSPTSPTAAPSMPMATPRQAKSAANVMAGKPTSKFTPQKRKYLLAITVVVVALPVAAFLLYGDRLLGSSSTLLVTSLPAPSAPITPPSTPTTAEAPANPARQITATTAVDTAVASLSAPAAQISAAPVLATPLPARAQPARRAYTRQTNADNFPGPRARTAASPRAAQEGGTPRSTVIDLDRPETNANSSRAAKPQNPQQATARRPPTTMDSAYAAYQAGNTQEATRLYREVLRLDPTQRDAWLGLAVIAHNSNQREAAMDSYKRVLRLEPQNATALAGLTSINNNADDPRQESRLRELLARSPQDADLNHSLALVLSGERRWSEAQQLFFKAHTLAPQEPQFAYNLAVTLDQLRKSALAAQYYETALNLAQGKAPSFDEARARTRLAALRASPVSILADEAKKP